MDVTTEATKEASLKLLDVHIGLIDPNPNNPNEMDGDTFSRLVEEITETGFIIPLTVIQSGTRYKLLNGEHRWRAAMACGYQYVPSIILSDERWHDQDIIDLVNLRINELRGRVSAEKLSPIYDRVVEKHGAKAAQKIMGITHDEVFRKLVRRMSKDIQRALPKDVAKKVEQAAKRNSDPNQFVKSISRILTKQARTMDSDTITFRHGNKDHAMINVSPDLFIVVSEIIRYAKGFQEDLNDILYSACLPVLQSFQARSEHEAMPGEEIVAEVHIERA